MTDSLAEPQEATTAVVADYLKKSFPSLLVEHIWDPSITSERFTLFTEDRGGVVHTVIVNGEFLRENSRSSPSTIAKVLNAYEVTAMMKKNGKKTVTVTTHYAIDVV